jgi:uncharacterized protein (TIGR04255 family)
MRRIYPRPPIVEAIIEFGFREAVGADTLIGPFERAFPTWHREGFRLSSRDQLRSLDLGVPGRLAAHVLAPYPGWESFIDLAREAVAALPAAVRESELTILGLRYTDRIELPDNAPYESYFTILPKTPRHSGEPLGFDVTTHHFEPNTNTEVVLTVTTGDDPRAASRIVIYDLYVMRAVNGGFHEWAATANELHELQREIFEDSITLKLRECFQ